MPVLSLPKPPNQKTESF